MGLTRNQLYGQPYLGFESLSFRQIFMVLSVVVLASIILTLFGGYFALRFSDKQHWIASFSSGLIIGLVVFDLIPESFELGSDYITKLNILVISVIGYLTYLLAFRFIRQKSQNKGQISVLTIILHRMLDGLSLSIAFAVSQNLGLSIALALLVHHFTDGLNTTSVMIRNHIQPQQIRLWLVLSASAPLIGIILSRFVNISNSNMSVLLALFAGFFMYIAISHFISESYHQHSKKTNLLFAMLGMATMYILSIFH